MGKIYDWIERHRKATRILALAIPVALLAVLTVPAVLFIPGFLDNVQDLRRQGAVRFYGFVVTPAVIATVCALIWSLGDGWERLGTALYSEDKRGESGD